VSLIYKSLQQLKSQHNPPGKTSPYARLHNGMVWPWKTILAVTVLTFLMLAIFFFVRQQIKNEEQNNLARFSEPTQDSDIRRQINAGIRTESNQTPGASNPETNSIESDSGEEPEAKADAETQQIDKQSQAKTEQSSKPQSIPPSTQDKKTEPQNSGSKRDAHQAELTMAFKEKARRNQSILAMEKQLRSSLNSPEEFADVLVKLKQKAGNKNAVVYKWQGIQALQNKEFTKAEQLFQKYIQKSGPDIAIQINIILAQIGQKKMAEARKNLRSMLKKHPENHKLNNLKTYLTKN
jgi:hypothetical protein